MTDDVTSRASGDEGLQPWYGHLRSVFLVLTLLGVWDVALKFLKWEMNDGSARLSNIRCFPCWMMEVLLPYLIWFALAIIPAWASWRWRLDRRPHWRTLGGHLLALGLHVVIFLLVYLTAIGFILHDSRSLPVDGRLSLGFRSLTVEKLVMWVWNGALTYLYLALTAHVLDFLREAREKARRASRLEIQLGQAQLQTLKSQLQPHFLFNALANIHALIAVDNEGAKRMVNLLSDLLRAALQEAGTQLASLEQEISFVDRYLDIQRVRFSNRLRVHRDIDGDCLALPVPHLVLQPLVENAIKHGIAPRVTPGNIWISARREGGSLSLRVVDDGLASAPASPSLAPESTGLGLRNTLERLRQLYGSAASLQAGPTPDRRAWEVLVRIPVLEGATPENPLPPMNPFPETP